MSTERADLRADQLNSGVRGSQSTASQIGVDRIAAVVDHFYDLVQQHPTLSQPFSVVTDWPQHKDHLTYFWWVTLGGEKYREVSFSVVLKHARAGFSADLLNDWKAAFGNVVRAEIPAPLAQAWLDKVERLGTSLLHANSLHQRHASGL